MLTDKELEATLCAAESGDVDAQYKLFEHYFYYDECEQSYDKAIMWLRKAEAQGYCKAFYHLGCCYLEGEGVEQNKQMAFQYFLKSVEAGCDGASILGDYYKDGDVVEQNYDEAVKWYLKAIETEDIGADEAKESLGLNDKMDYLYLDKNADIEWWKAVAAQCGHPRILYGIAEYCDMMKVDVGSENATQWYCKAADKGHIDAQYKLGQRLANGSERDIQQAVSWLEKAAKQGLECAMLELGQIYGNANACVFDTAKSFYWLTQLAGRGEDLFFEDASFALSWHYLLGEAVEADWEAAVDCALDCRGYIFRGSDTWWQARVEAGDCDAQYWLGFCYHEDVGFKQDIREAFSWYLKAAEKGHPEAQNYVGRFLLDGRSGISANKEEGIRWLKMAAKQYQPDAIEKLKEIEK